MKKDTLSVMIICIMVASLQDAPAASPIPLDCSGNCSDRASCTSCMDACESYLSGYVDVPALLDNLTKRKAVTDPNVDLQAVANLESCWCLACCDYGHSGDAAHPCIYQCPCRMVMESTTTIPEGASPEEIVYNNSLGEIKRVVNDNVCLILNLVWLTSGSIASVIVMFAGVVFLTSGDPESRRRARSQITGAFVALAITFTACPIVDYVISGTDITPFKESCECYAVLPNASPEHLVAREALPSGASGTATLSTTTSSMPGEPGLTILYVPVDWDFGMESFDAAVLEQTSFLLKNIPLGACPERLRVLKAAKSCKVGVPNDWEACRAEGYGILSSIEVCAKALGEPYDYVVGLAGKDACGGRGFSAGVGVVFYPSIGETGTTHELGHEWGLADEYDNCPSAGCKGSIDPSDARCIMGYLYDDADAKNGFCSKCTDYLKTLDYMKC